ncbi:TetR/AcrR family transcriptional regulator [Nocardioides marmoriginsengisoli]|uniref:TetR/AcrR family transcriptional regulator n=1 Tax=Nocardioides marmoriginsengisoli TaxID=661483 RepID=A0A3N0CEV8_9ACTN|nr:TetR family transcriptional regulator [Nocardioides marmoriginsengisoli]RNL61990.1 TetR/AcrR family transcriptional regulator [Nocardioides marmoriginsengisoli]
MSTEATPHAGLRSLLPGFAPGSAGSGSTWRARLIAEAADLTRSGGWQTITMAKLADRVGVSRQTVYNEIGSKQELAEAMVMHEVEGFLRGVDASFEAHPDDLVGAIREAAAGVLRAVRTNPLMHAVLSASHGAESDLLPLLTTEASPIIDAARVLIREHLDAYEVPLESARIDALVDMVIRLVLSHVTTPSGTPEETADDIAFIAERVLAL